MQNSEIEHLKQRLKQYKDYDEIKRELEIMKVSCLVSSLSNCLIRVVDQYVEFGGLEEDEDAESKHINDDEDLRLPNPNADKANAHHGKSLEALLATKNKRILEELTGFRVRGSNNFLLKTSDADHQIDSTY